MVRTRVSTQIVIAICHSSSNVQNNKTATCFKNTVKITLLLDGIPNILLKILIVFTVGPVIQGLKHSKELKMINDTSAVG